MALLAAATLVHEALHVLAARALGYDAKIRVKRVGPLPVFAVEVGEFLGARNLSELDPRKLRDYVMVALAPYAALLPLGLALLALHAFWAKIAAAVLTLLHVGSLFAEFSPRESLAKYVVAGSVAQALWFIALCRALL